MLQPCNINWRRRVWSNVRYTGNLCKHIFFLKTLSRTFYIQHFKISIICFLNAYLSNTYSDSETSVLFGSATGVPN